MTTVLNDAPAVPSSTSPAQRLRTATAAVRLSVNWLGVRKSLTPHQKSQAADTFGAEGQFLSAGKKLLDTQHAAFKAVTAVRGKAASYWRSLTLPYPEPGIRLIRQERIETFDEQMRDFRDELAEAVAELGQHYDQMKATASRRLGRLYNSADYPNSLDGLFVLDWDFPSVEPPHYLQQLNPELYRQECQRVTSRFDEAVHLAEQAFLDEFAKHLEHLTERLSGQSDGKPKVFRDSAVNNLVEFFERFRQLNIGSHEQLEELIAQSQQVVRGLQPQQLRDDQTLRRHVAERLSGVETLLEDWLIDRPRRNLLRRPR